MLAGRSGEGPGASRVPPLPMQARGIKDDAAHRFSESRALPGAPLIRPLRPPTPLPPPSAPPEQPTQLPASRHQPLNMWVEEAELPRRRLSGSVFRHPLGGPNALIGDNDPTSATRLTPGCRKTLPLADVAWLPRLVLRVPSGDRVGGAASFGTVEVAAGLGFDELGGLNAPYLTLGRVGGVKRWCRSGDDLASMRVPLRARRPHRTAIPPTSNKERSAIPALQIPATSHRHRFAASTLSHFHQPEKLAPSVATPVFRRGGGFSGIRALSVSPKWGRYRR